MTPKELGIAAGEIWAFNRGRGFPLIPVRIIHPGHHYQDRIVIEPRHGGHWRATVTRVKLPCRWDQVLEYLKLNPGKGYEVADEFELERAQADAAMWNRIDNSDRPWFAAEIEDEPPALDAGDVHVLGTLHNVDIQQPIAYSVKGAAAAVGYSTSFIRDLIARRELVPRYASSKAIILYDDLWKWAHELPTGPVQRY